jgi:hypothetical protein
VPVCGIPHFALCLEDSLARILFVLAVGVVVLSVIAIVRKLRSAQVSDYLSPQVMTRINTEYSQLPQ